MRNLQVKDVFTAARLIKELNFKNELKEVALKIAPKENTEVDETSIGFDFIYAILEKAIEKDCEEAVYTFLSGPFEKTSKEVSELDPFDLVEGVFKVASFEKWKSFLKNAIQ